MQNSVLRSIEKPLWPEYPVWGAGEAGREARGLGVCVVTLAARLPWLIRRASPPRGCCLRAFNGLCSSSIEQDTGFAGEKLVLSGAVMSSPRGSQRSVGAAQRGDACAAPQPLGTVPAALPRHPPRPAQPRRSSGVPQRPPQPRGQVVGTQQWPHCPKFLRSVSVILSACWDLSAFRHGSGATQAAKEGHKDPGFGVFFPKCFS